MLESVSVILVRPRFPENIGMVARAMGNMGAGELILVRPERWEKDKAEVLATSLGQRLLDAARVAGSLEEALAPFTVAIGSTARSGGWRRDICEPEEAARQARSVARQGGRAALVMGPEDDGLNNAEVELCTYLVNIPTAVDASSLNLAQATLLLLYECMKADRALPFAAPEGSFQTRLPARNWTAPARLEPVRRVTLEEEVMLIRELQDNLIAIDHLPAENSDWFMKTMRRFLRKKGLRRNEFDMLMGICRQMRNKLGR